MRDRRGGDRRPIEELEASFTELFYNDPAAAVSLLERNPLLRPRARSFAGKEFGVKVELWKRDNPWMSELFKRYLPSTEPEKIVSLGCGWGLDLLFLRDQYPNTSLVGIDNTNDPTSIQTALVISLLTDGEFLHKDLKKVNPTTLLPRKGAHSYVVARHPGPIETKNETQFWQHVLNTWAKTAIKRTQGVMLVTCLLEEEVRIIEASMRKNELNPQLHTFEGGIKLQHELRQGLRAKGIIVPTRRMDNHVLTVSS